MRPLLCLAFVVLAAAVPRVAAARPFEVPTFALDAGVEVTDPRVAVGTDGTMVFVWQSGAVVRGQRHSQAGVAVSPPVTIATGTQPRLAADTNGGYVVAYTRDDGGQRHLYGRRLDAAGQPIGGEIAVDQFPDEDVRLHEVLGVPSGSVFVFQQGIQCRLRRFDPAGTPLGDAAVVGENGWLFPFSATALDDGGFTVVWHDPSVHTFLGQSFNADGSYRAGPSFLPSGLEIQAIAATASGGFVAVGTVLSTTLRLAEIDASFGVVRTRDVETMPLGDTPIATLARDGVGRWLLVYATARYDVGYVALQGYLGPRARPLAADLMPLEPSFALAADPSPGVTTTLLPSGSFVSTWSTAAAAPVDARGFANVVSLCTPDVYVCGDGAIDPRCEECDAGPGNSDTAPDACRTSCRLPTCGDGVADGGEACDDGTASPCDGCDATCQPVAGLVCGDGILVPGCGDQCDDGNGVPGDGCATTCTLERIPGGGSPSTDCLSEWIVANPTNLPLVDGRGRMRRTQRCVDDDPACDADGGTPGTCTFRVHVCAVNTDVPGCLPAPLGSWVLAKPSSKQAARHPALAAARAAFAGVPSTLVGTSVADTCAAPIDVVVPLRGSAPKYGTGTLVLGATATAAGGARDKDGLKLVCLAQ